jgi:cytochrome c
LPIANGPTSSALQFRMARVLRNCLPSGLAFRSHFEAAGHSRNTRGEIEMRAPACRHLLISIVLASGALAAAAPALAADEDAAKKLFKTNDCTKCHAPVKTKKGPSLKKIAEEHRGKADAEEKLIKHMTTSPKVKLEDGTEEEHKIIETTDKAELKNLVEWMLAR